MSSKVYSEKIEIRVGGRKTRYINITQKIQEVVTGSGMGTGEVVIHILHTTTGLTDKNKFYKTSALMIQEDEPGLMIDIDRVLNLGAKEAFKHIAQISRGRSRMIEHLREEVVDLALKTILGFLCPKDGYKHDNFKFRTVNIGPEERKNAEAHLKASLFRESIVWTFENGRLNMGQWQSIIFWDFDPFKRGKRSIQVLVMGE